MAPKYKLHYFNIAHLGEPARFLFAYGNVEWEDIRYPHGDLNARRGKWDGGPEWAAYRSKAPFGQMPVLEIDGESYAQSAAISRHLAKVVGLYGKDEIENLKIDMIVDSSRELSSMIMQWYVDSVPASKAKKEDSLFKEQFPFYLNKFESMVKANGGYFINGRLTLADIYFVAPLKYDKSLVGKDFLEGYPALQELVKKVESQPNIAAYIAKRPACDP